MAEYYFIMTTNQVDRPPYVYTRAAMVSGMSMPLVCEFPWTEEGHLRFVCPVMG
jgi:hypothetical protein